VHRPLDLAFDPIRRAAQIWAERFGPADAMAAATSIMRVQQLLLTQYDRICRPYGLTFARYEALVLLTFSRTGALPMAKIGERLMVHPTSVTNTVQRLEAAGFVTREPNPRDGRGTLARVTEQGRAVVDKVTGELMAADFGLEALDERQRDLLVDLLRSIRLSAGDFREERPAG
jgi:DNA-binding MarR family transcriptional regulator